MDVENRKLEMKLNILQQWCENLERKKEKDEISLKEIFEQEHKKNIEKVVMKILIKTKENITREAAEKKKNIVMNQLK